MIECVIKVYDIYNGFESMMLYIVYMLLLVKLNGMIFWNYVWEDKVGVCICFLVFMFKEEL